MDARLVVVVACVTLSCACHARHVESDMMNAETSLQAGGTTGGATSGATGGTTGGATGGATGGTTGGTTGSPTGTDGGDSPSVMTCGDFHVDAGEACDDGNFEAGDGCNPDCSLGPGAALPPVWTADFAASAFAMTGSVLVVGGAERVDLVPLAPEGPAAWTLELPGERIEDIALTAEGDIVVASEEIFAPYLNWLRRIAASGAPIWSRDLPERLAARQVTVAPNGDIVLVTQGWPSALDVFDSAGVPRWSRSLPDEQPVREEFGGVALDAGGRIHAVSHRYDFSNPAMGLLRVEAFAPQGDLLWQAEHELSRRCESSHIALTSNGTLLVAAEEDLSPDLRAALLVEFDASGAVQWSRHDTSLYPQAGRWVEGAVPAPGGGMFAHWWFGGDHDDWTAAARYDAAGAHLYEMRRRSRYIADIAVGPDGVFYTLEYDSDYTASWLVPHLP